MNLIRCSTEVELAAAIYLHIVCLSQVEEYHLTSCLMINRRSQNSRIREVDTVPGVLWSREVLGEETAGVEHLVHHLRSSLRWQGGPCWLLWLEGLARLELLLLRSGLEGLECLLGWLRLEGLLGRLGLECLLSRLLKHFLSWSSWEGSEGFLGLSLCLEAVCREEDKWS